MQGKIACQETGGRAQAYRGGVPGDPRDMAKVGLPESQSPEGASTTPAGKTPETGAGPCGGMSDEPAAILRGAGAMPCQGIKGDGRDA